MYFCKFASLSWLIKIVEKSGKKEVMGMAFAQFYEDVESTIYQHAHSEVLP